jgi:hypothetical protein
MKTLLITRIKPNPSGKDRSRTGLTSASQLAAEWVDFKNIGPSPVDLEDIELYHVAYTAASAQGHWDKVVDFRGTLYSGRTVRVHSGSGPESVVRPEDRTGADHHLFTGRNYVWNNRQGDRPALFDSTLNQNVDQTSYDPYPPEGQVLVRSGNKLIFTAIPAYSRW